MKKKLILASAIFITTINSGFCATGQGYRILSEEIHSAPGFNFHVEEAQPGTAAALKKNKLNGSTFTSVPAKSGRVNQYIAVDSYHDFSISNDTNYKQTYTMYISLDCSNLHSYYTRHVELNPGGYYTNSDHAYGTVQEFSSGVYRIYGETKLSGGSTHSSRDSNNLYVNN